MSADLPPAVAPASLIKARDSEGFRPVPLTVTSVGHLYAAGTLNDDPVEILLDSGAGATVADRDWVLRKGLVTRPLGEKGAGAGATDIDVAEIEGAQLWIADVALDGIKVLVIDFAHISEGLKRKGVAPPQVVLGANVLHGWRAVIDYGTTTLWLADKADDSVRQLN